MGGGHDTQWGSGFFSAVQEGLDQKPTNVATAHSPSRIGKRILLADDHELLREALRAVIEGLEPATTLFECTQFDVALDLASQHDGLDLAILGLRMPGMGGVSGIRKFRERFPELPLIVCCCHSDPEEMVRALRQGASGFIPESLNGRGVKAVLELVLAGQVYVPADVLALIDRLQQQDGPSATPLDERSVSHALTRREQQTLGLLVDGHSNKGIARALDIQEVTVKLHLRSIFRKLNVANRAQAVRVAIEKGWFGNQAG